MVTGSMEGMVERRVPITLLLSATPGKSRLTYWPLTASFPRKNWCISVFFFFFLFGKTGTSLPFPVQIQREQCLHPSDSLVFRSDLLLQQANHGTTLVCGCVCSFFRKGNLSPRLRITLNSGFYVALHNRRDTFLRKGVKLQPAQEGCPYIYLCI